MQFWPNWIWVVVVVGIFGAGQFLEGNILQPRLVGSSIGVHPVWLMFALFAFGALFGFVGVLLAVPATAAIGVLVRFAVDRYRHEPASIWGQGGSPPPGVCPAERHAGSLAASAGADAPAELRARRLHGRTVERRGAAARRALAGLARAGRGAERAGRLRQDAPRPYLGGRAPARRSSPPPSWIGPEPSQLVAGSGIAIEDVAPEQVPEAALFHLINRVREAGASLLVTSRNPVAEWHVRLPDLRSRLRMATPAALGKRPTTSSCGRSWSSSSRTASSWWRRR